MPHTLPGELPVITLPNSVFFPKTVLPLHIFESRYRRMLQDVLDSHRMFAVAALDIALARTTRTSEPLHRVATAGMIGACQTNGNGTSDLLLVGLERVSVVEIVRDEPYRLIRVRSLPDETLAVPADLEKLRRELLRVFEIRVKLGERLPRELDETIHGIEDPAALCDMLVFALTGDAAFKQKMLETLDPAIRLRRAIERFRRETSILRLQRRLQGPLDDENIANN